MSWFKVDDGFHSHPKVVEALESRHGKGAIALWTLCGSWAGDQETDGFVPAAIVKRLGGTRQETDLLVAVRLWSRAEGGFSYHGWGERNPLKTELDDKREATRKRVSDWREKRVRNSVTGTTCNAVSNAAPDPTRPDPTDLNPPIPPAGGGQVVELRDASREAMRPPPFGGAPAAEVRDGWAEAWFAAGAGAPPRLVGSVLASAVAFAGDVARSHGRPLREAARAIASAALQAPGSDPTWHLTRLDPYAAPRASQAPSSSPAERVKSAESEVRAALDRNASESELRDLTRRVAEAKAARDSHEERGRYARR